MTVRNEVVGGAALVALALLAWLLWPAPAERTTTREVRPGPTAVQTARDAAGDPLADEPAFEPASPTEEALVEVAKLGGKGMITCPVNGLIPDGRVGAGLAFAVVKDGVLTATVHGPDGATEVPDPFPENVFEPEILASLTWSGAWPGAVSTCQVLPFETVRVRGVVLGRDGKPAPGSVVMGCGDQGTTDDEGRFELQATRGLRCQLFPRPGDDLTGFGLGTDIEPNGPLEGVTLEQTAPMAPQPGATEFLDALMSAEQDHGENDPFAFALDNAEDLSSEARTVLEGWAEERRIVYEEAQARREQLLERGRSAPAGVWEDAIERARAGKAPSPPTQDAP